MSSAVGDNVIDLQRYSHVDRWEDHPLARRVALALHRRDLVDRTLLAKSNSDWQEMDRLDVEWEGLSRY